MWTCQASDHQKQNERGHTQALNLFFSGCSSQISPAGTPLLKMADGKPYFLFICYLFAICFPFTFFQVIFASQHPVGPQSISWVSLWPLPGDRSFLKQPKGDLTIAVGGQFCKSDFWEVPSCRKGSSNATSRRKDLPFPSEGHWHVASATPWFCGKATHSPMVPPSTPFPGQ